LPDNYSPVPPDQDYEFLCDNPSTDGSNFSADWNILRHRTDLFAYTIGVSGTVKFELCFAPNGFTADVAGRIGFAVGRTGSIQDEATEGQKIDDDLQLQLGMPYGVGGNWGYAKIVKADANGNLSLHNFGEGSLAGYYTGASDRYTIAIDQRDNVAVRLRADLIGDATRLEWQLTNLDQTNAVPIGLWFGQYVVGLGPTTGGGPAGMRYVRVPGQRPLNTNTHFSRNPVTTPDRREFAMPPQLEFGLTQSWAYGLKVITQATEGENSAFFDQTPCDALEVGDAGVFRTPSLLGPQGIVLAAGNSRPMSTTFPYDDVFFTSPPGDPTPDGSGYIQKWTPTTVGAGNTVNRTRTIVAYYTTTTGNSNFARPYAATVDAPRTIGVRDANPFQFNPATSTIRVYVDNTRGFSTVNQSIPLYEVRVTLDLPQGMTDANSPGSTSITKFIDRVDPNNAAVIDPFINPIKYVDFQVNVAPDVVGTQFYTVTIEPKPGTKKVISGSINVASQPRLLIRPQANLVTAPWEFVNTTWSTILGSGPDPLQQDVDYQAFTWDAQRQEYVLQTGPQRGRGTWIVSARNVGSKVLGGTPRTPSDLATGGTVIQLKPGWNLIANPYNYPIEIGQIIGVSGTSTSSMTFEQLSDLGVINSSMAYWDQTTQSYKYTNGFTAEMLPNLGYWLFVSSNEDVTINFPPVFTPFVPRGTGGIQNAAGWQLNLVARTARGIDDQNYIGIAANQDQARRTRVFEPPIAPVPGAVSAAIVEGNLRLSTSLRPKAGTMEWRYDVTPRENGTVTVTWPNLSSIPSNVKVNLVDSTLGTNYDLRKLSSVSFFGKAGKTQSYRIIAQEAAAVALLSNVGATATTSAATIKYSLGDKATTSVRILQAGTELVSLSRNKSETAGAKSLAWNLRDAANRRVRPGVYVAEIRVTSGTGQVETKTVSFLVR
jgi:hypothetical protein